MAGNNAAAGPSSTQPRRSPGGVIRALLVVLVLLTGMLAPLDPRTAPAWAWNLPGQGQQRPIGPAPLQPSAPTGRLQEQAPPVAVQQLQEALAERQPLVEIISPRDGALLSDGPWELRARVRDWPLADAGRLGLGAHLVVQVDAEAPLRLVGDPSDLRLQVPALAPGSHRITVYAAKPWGEAVKSPGAICQIRLHRVAANPLGLPAPGSPQLIPVSPTVASATEPVLLDWILLDAPLQNLRPGDGSWRLRVSINGDSFLLDQNVPLWLQGWRPGNNSLLLELVDGLGDALNAPFNSQVLEVNLPGNGTAQSSPPRWLQGRLSEQELGLLLGSINPAELEAQAEAPGDDVNADQGTNGRADEAADDRSDADEVGAPIADQPAENKPEPDALEHPLDQPANQAETDLEPLNRSPQPSAEEPSTQEASTQEATAQEAGAEEAIPDASRRDQQASPQPLSKTVEPVVPVEAATADTTEPEAAAPSRAPTQTPAERVSSSSSLVGSARDQVNPDGSLIKPKPNGPLAGLRQRLNP